MMFKVAFISVFVVTLAGLVSMQQQPGQSLMQNLPLMPTMQNMQNMPSNPNMQGMGMGNNMLGNLLGGNNGGLGETLRQLPARGMQMVNNLLGNVRTLLPGLGRNPMPNMNMNMNQQEPLGNLLNQLSSTLNLQGLQNPMNNMQNPMNNMQNPLNNMQNPLNNMQNPMNNMQNPLNNMMNRNGMGINLPRLNLESLARPVTDALNQGRLPGVNEMAQGLTRSLSDTVRNLATPNNVQTTNNASA